MHYLHFFRHYLLLKICYLLREMHYLHFRNRRSGMLRKVKYVKVRVAENKRGKRP